MRTADGMVFLLNSYDGEVRWQVATDLPVITLIGMSVPLFFANTLITGLDDGRVVGFDLDDDGALVFEFQVGASARRGGMSEFSDVDGPLAIRDGIIYASSALGRTVAFDLGRRALVWVHQEGSYRGVAIGDENLYLINRNGQIEALDLISGEKLWTTEIFSKRTLTTPLSVYPFVVVGDNLGYLYWLSEKRGTVLARTRATRHPLRTLSTLPDETHVLALGDNGSVSLFHAQKPKAR